MESLYPILQHLHSALRWFVLIFLLLTIIFSLTKWIGKKPFWSTHKKYALFTLIFSHLQLVLGLILFFISPKIVMDKEAMKNEITRFFMVEHFSGMLLAIIIITIGYVIGKRALPEKSAKVIFWFYTIALILILAFIPWPFRGLGAGWI